MNIKKQAARDAYEWARAEMYFGEGAGNRRKLITAQVASYMERYPQYRGYFNKFLEQQDMAKHAQLARRERRRRDVAHAINKNVKAAASGQYGGVNAAVLVTAVAVYYAHQSGYDKKLYDALRARYEKLRKKAKEKKEPAQAQVHDISSAAR